MVVTIEDKGQTSWLVLDAKYRIGFENLGDALGTAHIYRDSLRRGIQGERCVASLLVSPANTPKVAEWFSDEFRSEFGVGVIELNPGTPIGNVADIVVGSLKVRPLKAVS